jgi:hypothetical protein
VVVVMVPGDPHFRALLVALGELPGEQNYTKRAGEARFRTPGRALALTRLAGLKNYTLRRGAMEPRYL